MSDLRPKNPDCDGRQFARNPYDSDNYLSVRRNEEYDEIPEDRPMHKEATPGQSGPINYSGPQYHELDSYGKSVSGSSSASTTSVDIANAKRGKER